MGETKTVLENQELYVEVNTHGSELARIYDKVKDREIIWESDPKIWNRHAPILFPFIGKSFEDKYRFQGKTYPITAHGFARDKDFTLDSRTENEVWYRLESTPETMEIYPFPFILMAAPIRGKPGTVAAAPGEGRRRRPSHGAPPLSRPGP